MNTYLRILCDEDEIKSHFMDVRDGEWDGYARYGVDELAEIYASMQEQEYSYLNYQYSKEK